MFRVCGLRRCLRFVGFGGLGVLGLGFRIRV